MDALNIGPSPGDARSCRSLRAVVVEDHDFQRSTLAMMLRAIGVLDVEEAANGRDALLALERHPGQPADVVLCDLDMPEMDGVEFLRLVAERQLARGVIIVSGREAEILWSAEAMARASGLMVLGRLRKPPTLDALRDLLERKPDAPRPATAPEALADVETARLVQAFETGEFGAQFQPKVHLASGALVGVEALARWNPAGARPIRPDRFIPALVRADLITRLTEHMLDLACHAIESWGTQGLAPEVSINLSMASLAELAIVDRLAARVTRCGIAPHRITFEVTESELMADLATVLNVLTRLRLKGFRLSIDDFGTGYSSLSQLNRIPFTELKIDRSFVRNCDQTPRLRNIVESSIGLAQRLQIRTVAEGVESQSEWAFLREAGCDEAQGYHVAHPLPAGKLGAWIQHWNTRVRPG